MALDHKSASKHIDKSLSKGHIVKPLKELKPEDMEMAKAKAKEKTAKKAPAKKKAKK